MRAKQKRNPLSAFYGRRISIGNKSCHNMRAEKMAQDWEFGGLDFGPLPTTVWEAMEKFIYVLSGSLATCFLRTLPFFF